ncbi:hypothetical protein ACIQVK_19760 [Streptomyces sp. NPDC090493]|uniref:hypothetical protein n=1 Tax=Streptomyces sp. NPDC090493 TaxID=3365964 RepID=UPI0038199AD1
MTSQPEPSPGHLPSGRLPVNRRTDDSAEMITETEIRDILRPHVGNRPISQLYLDGGPISRLYATGEITDATIPALGVLAADLDDQAADQVDDVIRYARDVGDRPPVPRWLASH